MGVWDQAVGVLDQACGSIVEVLDKASGSIVEVLDQAYWNMGPGLWEYGTRPMGKNWTRPVRVWDQACGVWDQACGVWDQACGVWTRPVGYGPGLWDMDQGLWGMDQGLWGMDQACGSMGQGLWEYWVGVLDQACDVTYLLLLTPHVVGDEYSTKIAEAFLFRCV